MQCPYCGSHQVMVVNSRATMSSTQIWRRRKCLNCENLYTTHETMDLSHLIIVKKDGQKEKYNKIKLYSGIYNAMVSSRPKERQKLIDLITREIERNILLLKKRKVSTTEIGEIVLNTLKIHSPGTFLGFLTYYKNISTQSQMRKELAKYIQFGS